MPLRHRDRQTSRRLMTRIHGTRADMSTIGDVAVIATCRLDDGVSSRRLAADNIYTPYCIVALMFQKPSRVSLVFERANMSLSVASHTQ